MARVRLHYLVIAVLLVVGVFQWSLGFNPPCSIGCRVSTRVSLGLYDRSGTGLGGSSWVNEKAVKSTNYIRESSPLPMRGRDIVVTGLKAEASEGECGSRLRGRFVGVGSCTPEVVSMDDFVLTCLHNASVLVFGVCINA